MTQLPQECSQLSEQVNQILALLRHEDSLNPKPNTTAVEADLRKVVAPKFYIVFAGAFSAGKSMLINALLERELLYSAEGHATGTECSIEYAQPEDERVILTFLSATEILEQANFLCSSLGLSELSALDDLETLQSYQKDCKGVIQNEGGEGRSEIAKQAKALSLLLEGYQKNQERIGQNDNYTYAMTEFNFYNLTEAANYARRGSNSAVLKRLEYYCDHPLLADGNVIIDTPGIDAPVERDRALTYDKIKDPDTSAVVCVLKPAAAGEMTTEETELLELIKGNPGVRDRVFYVFNRIDETWYNAQLRQRLEGLVSEQFWDSDRVYQTSALLGFYGSQVKQTSERDRFGLDSIFSDSVRTLGGEEDTPQFVSEFNNYCGNSGKLSNTIFRVSIHSYETPNQNYVRILNEWGNTIINQLIQDSGIEDFRTAITRYLTEEKRPQLFITLADDLEDICIELAEHWKATYRDLTSQPQEIESMKRQELQQLNQQLKAVGEEFRNHFSTEVNEVIVNDDHDFEADFNKLQARMVSRLDELLQTFSVRDAYSRATYNHPYNSTAPLIAVLVEALYYLANELEKVLEESAELVLENYFQRLLDKLRHQDYYRRLYRLVGDDSGIESKLENLKNNIVIAVKNAAHTECDRYVRESPRFYDEGTFSIYQFRETLKQTSQSYDAESMVEAEPSIRQLLKLDFEPKVDHTIRTNFRQIINNTLKTNLLPMADQHAETILQQYEKARENLEQTLEQEAAARIAHNQRLQTETQEKVHQYNEAVKGINACLKGMGLYENQLSEIILAG
ncbi:MAG: dynamin family protein [Halothece sp.]